MAYGIVETGFRTKPLEACKSELEALFRQTFGAGINLDPSTPEGQLIGILAGRESELWDLAAGVYSSRDPDQASGAALSGLCAITGTVGPKPATRSRATITLGGLDGTLVQKSSQVSVTGTSGTVRFTTLADATLAAVSAWAVSTVYAPGDRRTRGGNVYEVVVGGTSAASGGPTGTGTAIADGSVTWRYLGSGSGAVDVACEATETGPKAAPARTLTVIETPVSGWSWATNALDARLGTDLETDAALRSRRQVELASSGASALDAIRAALLKVPGVTACTVFENTTMATDSSGRPAKSIEVLVSGGTDAEVRAAVWAAKPGGIESHGSNSGTVVDSQGVTRTVKFSRPTTVNVYVVVNLQRDPTKWPADGVMQVQNQLLSWAQQNLTAGVDVVSFQLKRALTVSGIVDITSLYLGTATNPTSEAKVGITATQIAALAVSRITVNATDYSDT